jgi:hypothetical protein
MEKVKFRPVSVDCYLKGKQEGRIKRICIFAYF